MMTICIHINRSINGPRNSVFQFNKESEEMIKKGKELMKIRKPHYYCEYKNSEPIKAMLEMLWTGFFAPYSIILTDTESKQHTEKVAKGTKYAISLSNMHNLSDVRDAFISMVFKGMQFNTYNDIKIKHIECIRVLLDVAMEEGNYLGNGWKYIFECMSKVENMFNIKAGHTDKELFGMVANKRKEDIHNKALDLLSSKIDSSFIDIVFMKSINIDDDKIEEFIQNLCLVSRAELCHKDDPRIFCLQKIVEVADINLNRARVLWSHLWRHISNLLIEISNNANKKLVIYAIDSLKQLTTKFLTVLK